MNVPPPFDSGFAAVRIHRDVIRATGEDAEKFLQGQLSQDIATLGSGESAWSLLLAPQGKVNAWMRVTRLGDSEFLMDLDQGSGASALERLKRFLLRTKCELELLEWQMVAIRGAGAGQMKTTAGPGIVAVADAAWPGIDGIDLLGPDVEIPDGIAHADVADLELLRIALGVPKMGAELDEGTIPAEAGIVERSVSFTKGCYTGQELVARIDSRGGNVPRHLRRVTSSGPIVVGEQVTADGAEVGRITSAAQSGPGWLALGYISRRVDVPAQCAVASGAVTVEALVD